MFNMDLLDDFYHATREHSGVRLNAGNQFKSYGYFNVKGKSYLLMNEIEENEELVRKGKKTRLFGVSGGDAFLFPLTSSDLIPKRQLVFDAARRDHSFGMFSAMQYDPATNKFVFMKMSRTKGSKSVKMVWMEP